MDCVLSIIAYSTLLFNWTSRYAAVIPSCAVKCLLFCKAIIIIVNLLFKFRKPSEMCTSTMLDWTMRSHGVSAVSVKQSIVLLWLTDCSSSRQHPYLQRAERMISDALPAVTLDRSTVNRWVARATHAQCAVRVTWCSNVTHELWLGITTSKQSNGAAASGSKVGRLFYTWQVDRVGDVTRLNGTWLVLRLNMIGLRMAGINIGRLTKLKFQ